MSAHRYTAGPSAAQHQLRTSRINTTPERTIAQMEQLLPIKMQHAAAQFIIAYLEGLNNGFYGEETAVGSEDDRRGIDFRIKHRLSKETNITVDFSIDSKDGFAVRLKEEWFERTAGGNVVFRKCCAQALVRAFLPAMLSESDKLVGLLGWKLGLKK